jgi:hypothetical protein
VVSFPYKCCLPHRIPVRPKRRIFDQKVEKLTDWVRTSTKTQARKYLLLLPIASRDIVTGLFHAQGFGRLDAGDPQGRQKAGGERDDGKDRGNHDQGDRIVIAYAVKLAAEYLGGEQRTRQASNESERRGNNARGAPMMIIASPKVERSAMRIPISRIRWTTRLETRP